MLKVLINKQIDEEELLIERNLESSRKQEIKSFADDIDKYSENSSVVMTMEDTTIDSSLAIEYIADIYSTEIT